MQKEILSLRNIYRFLTVNDYPIYSSGILKEESKKGLTLTKFWQGILLYEFRSGYYGRQIWKNTGGRNRHISEICNRSEVLKWYPQYTEELVQNINAKTLLLQIQQFVDWLKERKYDGDVFDKKLRAFLTVLAESDECFNKEMTDYFQYNLEAFQKQTVPKEFVAGWLLTILSIHALTGERMQSEQMQRVRNKEEFSLASLWKEYKCENDEDVQSVHFLTGRNNAMCVEPLEKMHFFGREAEVFELRELLGQGGYYLLSGMGGIGKTELLRQLLHICVKQKLVDEIALIQYEGSLADSCISAFPGILGDSEIGILQEAMARIRMQEGKRVLTLVDNMNKTPEEDPNLAQLLTLPGTVIVSSRLTSLDGFTTYQVETLNKEMGALVFRDHYRSPISREDKEELGSIMEQELWRHTLTLKLLGNMARNKKWTIRQLREKLFMGGSQLLKPREDRENNLAEMYCRMYDLSELSEKQVKFLRCFAVFPYQNYSDKFMQTFMAELMGEDLQMDKLLEYGWVSQREQGYTMHPVIAECVLSKPPVEADVECFLCALEKYWGEKCGAGKECDLEKWYQYSFQGDITDDEYVRLFVSVGVRLQGELSERFFRLTAMVGILGINSYVLDVRVEELSREAIRNGKVKDEIVEACLNLLARVIISDCDEKKEYYMSLWMKINEKGNSPLWLRGYYGTNLVQQMIYLGEIDIAREILDNISEYKAVPCLQVVTEAKYGLIAVVQTQRREAVKRFDNAILLMKRHNLSNGALLQWLLYCKHNYCIELGDMVNAMQCLEELEKLLDESETLRGRLNYYECRSAQARAAGDWEESLEYLEKELVLVRNLVGENQDYAILSSQIALNLHKLGRYEEAEEWYLSTLHIFLKEGYYYEMQISRTYNNMSDMYLCWNKPQKALECLKQAEDYGKSVEGVGAAEVKRNFARTYRMLGATEKEYEYLQLAVPLLTEAYGPDHERTVAMRERLEEIETGRK